MLDPCPPVEREADVLAAAAQCGSVRWATWSQAQSAFPCPACERAAARQAAQTAQLQAQFQSPVGQAQEAVRQAALRGREYCAS